MLVVKHLKALKQREDVKARAAEELLNNAMRSFSLRGGEQIKVRLLVHIVIDELSAMIVEPKSRKVGVEFL